MQTRREYLADLGLAKIGRGKFSTAAKAQLDKARSEGIKFSDEVVTEVVKPTGEKTTEVKTKPKGADFTPWVSPDDYRFPEAEYRAVAWVAGKRVVYGMREACNNCGASLTNHICNTPSVLGHPVTIEAAA